MDVPQHISDFFDKLPEFPPKPDTAKSLVAFCNKHFGKLSGTVFIANSAAIDGLMSGMILSSSSEQQVLRAHHAAAYEYVYSELLGGHVRIGERA